MQRILADLRSHFAPFADKRALVLIAIGFGLVYSLDPALAKTVAQWAVLFVLFLGGIVIASRYVLPQIRLTDLVSRAEDGNTAAGLVVLGLMVFLGALAIAVATWGKP